MANQPKPGKRRWHQSIYRQALHKLKQENQARYEQILHEIRTDRPFEGAER